MVQSLDRGMRILEYLVDHKSAGCSEIAELLEINKSSAFRLLRTLLKHDLVQQEDITGKYMLGIGILRISEGLLANTDIVEISKPCIEKLVLEAQESVHLCALSNNKATIVMDVKSREKINVSAKVGVSEPWHCSSVGKCLLAFVSDKKREEILDGIEYTQYTAQTILDEAALLKELDRVYANGYALDNEELSTGIRCLAAPIFNHKGVVKHCVAISGTTGRIEMDQLDRYIHLVIACAEEISAKLGCVKSQ